MVIIEAYMAGALEERKKWEKLANMIVRLEYCNDSCLIEEEINELKEIVNDR